MATLAGKPRQRAWKPKNRTGCKTCKIRKVKCDEEKPHCKRCTTTGRTCDGYDPNFRPPPSIAPTTSQNARSTVHGYLSPQTNHQIIRSPSPIYLAPALHLNTIEERESFEFFTSHAVSSLRGFLESSFWQREILQAAHRDPAIQHCVIALGAMHRRFFEGKGSHINEEDMSDKYLQFALRQSNQAIQDLIKKAGQRGKMAKKDKVTLMTCSILFSSMSCLQGHQKDALGHLRSGIRMLNEMDSEGDDKAEDHPVDLESLRSLFVGLDMQARSTMPSSQSQGWVSRPRTKAPSILLRAELSMSSLLAMLRYTESLLNHIHWFFQYIVSRPPEEEPIVESEYRDLINRFRQGAAVLETLSNMPSSSTDEFAQPLTALQLLHCQIEYFLRSPRRDLEEKFNFLSQSDFMDDLFDEPFDLSAQFIKMFELATRLLPISTNAAPVFTTTIGPTSALWLVAMRAPSTCAALRKRAVSLMLSHPRREGFWDGMIAGQIAQEALRLEQENTQAELGLSAAPTRDLIVPDDLRILVVAVSFVEDNDRKAKVEYSNIRDMKEGRPGSVQWIIW
ncbi:hypothetical protein BKA66DRAFT_317530 [Pyrenochaeta sp. MPI-SDFR-AT-0127]|nr:hypothetical protein BKA66DRAFT_317530 [Pyrenochaeta sp. MPI-SDFR-AT-0127]